MEARPPTREPTPRQMDVLRALADGSTNKQIARALGIQPATVRANLNSLYQCFGVRTRTALVATALRSGVI